MTNTTKLIAKLALAIGLIGSVAVGTVTPSLAAPSYTAQHRGSAAVDDPPGSQFQTQGNDESMGLRG
jgi:hypothetical protein